MTRPAGHVVLEVDVTPVLHAIHLAEVRLNRLAGGSDVVYANAALAELGNIFLAKQAYDAAIIRERARAEKQRAAATEYLTATEPAGRS